MYDALADAVVLLRTRPEGRRRVIIVVGESRDIGSNEKFGEVLRQAQLANIVIYAVGLSTTSAVARYAPQRLPRVPSRRPARSASAFSGTVQTPTSVEQHAGNMDMGTLAELAVRGAAGMVIGRPLEMAAAATGGLYRTTFRNRSIEDAVAEIGGDLNTQYTLTYEPANPTSRATMKSELPWTARE